MNTFNNDICRDCGKNTADDPKDYYMIRNDLWAKYGVAKGMLCMECIETRIGRKLTKKDLTNCIVNISWNPYTKNILNA